MSDTEETDGATSGGSKTDSFDSIIKAFDNLPDGDRLRLLQRLSGAKPKVEQPLDASSEVESKTSTIQSNPLANADQQNPDLANADQNAQRATDPVTLDESKIPRLPKFTGVVSKTDTSFRLWRFEVDNLLLTQREDSVKRAIQRSLSGGAADVRMRLGLNATVAQILSKFDKVFGIVTTQEQLLCDFYSSKQKSGESIAEWSCRLEDLLNHPLLSNIEQKQSMLKSKFFTGLYSVQIKNAIRHRFDDGTYDDLLVLARAAEEEFKSEKAISKPQVVDSQPDKLDQVLKELNELKGKIADWESRFKSETTTSSKPATTKGYDLSQVICHYCKKKGHIKRNCPKLLNKKQSAAEGKQ